MKNVLKLRFFRNFKFEQKHEKVCRVTADFGAKVGIPSGGEQTPGKTTERAKRKGAAENEKKRAGPSGAKNGVELEKALEHHLVDPEIAEKGKLQRRAGERGRPETPKTHFREFQAHISSIYRHLNGHCSNSSETRMSS